MPLRASTLDGSVRERTILVVDSAIGTTMKALLRQLVGIQGSGFLAKHMKDENKRSKCPFSRTEYVGLQPAAGVNLVERQTPPVAAPEQEIQASRLSKNAQPKGLNGKLKMVALTILNRICLDFRYRAFLSGFKFRVTFSLCNY